jgi:aryl-alcohol dehydrogenase-like predicted oxidoreductase
LTNSKKHWEKTRYKNYKEINRWLLNKSKFFRRQSITDLCLSYIKSQNWIDGIIIGVDSRKQLLENIRLINLNKLSLAEISDINISRPKITNALLNPHKWRNKF